MTNPFEALAERQTPVPVKRRMETAARRKSEREIAQQSEDAYLSKEYARYKREQKDALLAGPHGEDVKRLLSFLRTMTLDSAPALMGLVQDAAWLKSLSIDERHTLFGIMARSVARCRERAGLAPYDDALIGEPPKALHVIRDVLGLR
jgi:hypothetical protein